MNPAAIEKPKLYSKLSEIGEIPEEWKVVKVGDAFNQRNEIIQPSGKGEHKFVGLEHINPGEIGIHAYQLDTDLKSSKFRFYRGDILYGKLRPYLDKAVIADFDGICSTDLLVLTNIDNKALAEFLIYLIHSNQFIQNSISSTSGTNHPRTSWKEISKFEFRLPPLPEQRRIAEVLGTVDSAIQKVGGAIESTERLKKGLMQRLLTKGIGHERFRISKELGCEIPDEWDVVKLGDVTAHVGSGLTPRGGALTYLDRGIPLIRSQNVLMNKLDLSDVAYISQETHKYMARSIVLPGDLLLNITGASIGRVTVIPKSITEANVNQHVCSVRFSEVVIPVFASYYLSSTNGQHQIMSFQAGATRQGLNYQQVKSILIPLPPLSEQRRIAEILSAVDRKLELERRRKEKLERVKMGLMNELLTGRKRLKV